MGRHFAWQGALAALGVYVVFAYGLAPAIWRHYEGQSGLAALPAVTRTPQGIPGDALNVGLEGVEDEVICALRAAGWTPADPVTLKSSARIVGSVLLNRAYRNAPISPLLYAGRPQDLAFEKPSGNSPSRRHHVRLWKVLEAGEAGRPVWLGGATFDASVGLSHFTGQVTHHIAADVDAERDEFSAGLAAAGKVEAAYKVSGVGPTLMGRNGGGDRYFTDGDILISALARGCQGRAQMAPAAPDSLPVAAKNWLWPWVAAMAGRGSP